MSILQYFSGKKVIITGAASGIGKHLAELFIEAGAVTALFDINEQSLHATAKAFAYKYNCKVFSSVVDVTDFNSFKKSVEDVIAEIGLIDIFINNAGVGVSGDFVNNSVEEINKITGVNYLGMIYGSKIILEHFYKQGYGHLVNMASVAGLQGYPRMSLYCATKSGIIGFSQGIRFELERHGIDISVGMPSTTDTPMILDKLDGADDAIPGILLAIPMCKVEDVAIALFKGIYKKKFMIFPTITDRGSLFVRNFLSVPFNMFIRAVGFKDYRNKRQKLLKEYGIQRDNPE